MEEEVCWVSTCLLVTKKLKKICLKLYCSFFCWISPQMLLHFKRQCWLHIKFFLFNILVFLDYGYFKVLLGFVYGYFKVLLGFVHSNLGQHVPIVTINLLGHCFSLTNGTISFLFPHRLSHCDTTLCPVLFKHTALKNIF